MPIQAATVGEDVPITVQFTDDAGTAIDPDDQGTDGVADADITITNTNTDTAVVSAAAMTRTGTGAFEYVWDTTNAAAVAHSVDVSAEFSGETKIVKESLQLR